MQRRSLLHLVDLQPTIESMPSRELLSLVRSCLSVLIRRDLDAGGDATEIVESYRSAVRREFEHSVC
jgi:uridine kinase